MTLDSSNKNGLNRMKSRAVIKEHKYINETKFSRLNLKTLDQLFNNEGDY